MPAETSSAPATDAPPSGPPSAGREFARRFNNTLVELQLQTGIHRRIENILNDWSAEHPNLRGSYISREVDASYFADPECPPEAISRPKLHGIAIDGEKMFEFVAFAQGLRQDVVDLRSVVHVQETWLEPKPDEPFIYRVALFHTFPATTVLLATTGEQQDSVQEFVARLKYLKGW